MITLIKLHTSREKEIVLFEYHLWVLRKELLGVHGTLSLKSVPLMPSVNIVTKGSILGVQYFFSQGVGNEIPVPIILSHVRSQTV